MTLTQNETTPDFSNEHQDETHELIEPAPIVPMRLPYSGTTDVPNQPKDSLSSDLTELRAKAPLQEWEGYVIEVIGQKFWARLSDVSKDSPKDETEDAEFSFADVALFDQEKIREGAIFRWVIQRNKRTGSTESVLVFRDLPRLQDTSQTKSTIFSDIEWETSY